VRSARHVADDEQAISRLLHADFDPDREILLHDAPATVGPTVEQAVDAANVGRARAIIAREDSREQDIEADAPEDGFLLLADTFYPGWSAELDGRPVPIYRANLSLRGIELPKGQHHVRFSFTAPGFSRGRLITPLAISALLVWLAVAAYLDRRHASATRTNATQP
jgi:hypothetical protein